MSENASFEIINIDDILPNRFQPRIKFEDDSLNELAESISKFGVIEPIVVRPIGNKYEIIAGERRYKASKLASKSTIPAIKINLSDKDSEELALLENVQRQALNPIEEAVSYKRILDMGYISRDELAKKIGKTQSLILSKTRLLNLSDEVQSYLLNNKISERHARALLNINNLDDQVELLHRIVNERLTVKQTNREIKKYLELSKKNELNDNTEFLFGDERGKDKMDIDKIKEEAKDINFNEAVSLQSPNLMANNDGINVNSSSESPQNMALQGEPNKFVNFVPNTQDPNTLISNQGATLMDSQGSSGVTFDSMFNTNLVSNVNYNQDNSQVNVEPADVAISNDAAVNNISEAVSDALNIQNGSELQNNLPFNNSNVLPNINNDVNTIQSSVSNTSELVSQAANVSMNVNGDNISNISVQPSADNVVDQNQPMFNSIPDVSIVNEKNAGNVNSFISSNAASVNNMFDFAQIVQKLRDCANEIEKNGKIVNLEEQDLGDKYKVVITFDK